LAKRASIDNAPFFIRPEADPGDCVSTLRFSECQQNVGEPGAVQPERFIKDKIPRTDVQSGGMNAE
jgi:hypothetical protein